MDRGGTEIFKLSVGGSILDFEDIFMPKGLCAKCGEGEPGAHHILLDNGQRLSFCNSSCLTAFVQGIQAAKVMSL
jgi:hypothetical protein